MKITNIINKKFSTTLRLKIIEFDTKWAIAFIITMLFLLIVVCIYYTQSVNLVADLHETNKAIQALDDKMEAKVDNLLYIDSGLLFLVVFLFFLVVRRL